MEEDSSMILSPQDRQQNKHKEPFSTIYDIINLTLNHETKTIQYWDTPKGQAAPVGAVPHESESSKGGEIVNAPNNDT